MHRKKFLSFLGMAAVAAPILANELPKQEEVKPLELKKAALEGFAEPVKAVEGITINSDYTWSVMPYEPGPGIGTMRMTSNGGNDPRNGKVGIWNGKDWDWVDLNGRI